MEINEDLPKHAQAETGPRSMSITELQEYIAEMHEEIERVRAEIARRKPIEAV